MLIESKKRATIRSLNCRVTFLPASHIPVHINLSNKCLLRSSRDNPGDFFWTRGRSKASAVADKILRLELFFCKTSKVKVSRSAMLTDIKQLLQLGIETSRTEKKSKNKKFVFWHVQKGQLEWEMLTIYLVLAVTMKMNSTTLILCVLEVHDSTLAMKWALKIEALRLNMVAHWYCLA